MENELINLNCVPSKGHCRTLMVMGNWTSMSSALLANWLTWNFEAWTCHPPYLPNWNSLLAMPLQLQVLLLREAWEVSWQAPFLVSTF